MTNNKNNIIIIYKGGLAEWQSSTKTLKQIILEIRKLMLEEKISQRQIAESLGITPQGFTKLINKKNFSFEDAQKILNAMGYHLIYDFEKN